MNQAALTFELPAQVEAALLACHKQGQGTTDYHAMRSVALALCESGLLPVEAAASAEAQPADTTKQTARTGRRAGRDAALREVECGSCGGYGYTEAVSLAWSESEFREFACSCCDGAGFFEVAA